MDEQREKPIVVEEVYPKDPNKTYGLMEIMHGSTPVVDKGPENTVFSWPHLVHRELVLFLAFMAVVLAVSIFADAPLEEFANPNKPTNPAKAPWYFLGLQEMVSYDAFIGGVLIPALIVIGLMAIPYIDRNPKGVGVYYSHHRKLALTLFTMFVVSQFMLVIYGTIFRGPNWAFYWPWQEWPH